MKYSRKIAQHDIELFWNMEYSWNIPEKCYNMENFLFMEYGNITKKSNHNEKCHFIIPFLSFHFFIFEILPQQCIFSIFGIWNIPNKTRARQILKSVVTNSKTIKISRKFWNMKYSIEYSRSIPKIVKQATGRKV